MSAATEACKDRLEQFLRRNLAGWQGLPADCAELDIAQWLPLRPGEGITHLGSETIEYRFRVAEAPGFTAPPRLHFRDGVLFLVRTGLWSTDRTECTRLLRDLGEPPDRLDLVFGTGLIANGEWVYAASGLSLGVIPDTGLIASVNAFVPCSVDVYRRRFHDPEPAREFPID
jgi:hypothetical protein